ncbi:MAG: metal ABC transporter permease [Candidatus Bipolaricaulis sp.]|nr:metal ABC transporter permease [Candidatus Bipolaricaulis sp.]MDD5646538.1 metal ABC transporter permease [Candidatus Bipolaricaulis sp.]
MIHWLVAPFHYPFMVRAFAASVLVSGLCSLVGAYVVLRSMAFLGDALAHSVLPGIAAGLLVSGRGDRRSLFWWALGTAVAIALGIGWIGERGKLREDTAIGIVFAGMFALGVALLSTARGFAVDLVHILFGNVLGVSMWDLGVIGGFGIAILLIVVLFYKEFLVVTFDPTFAATLRIRAPFYRRLLLVLVAVVVVVSLQTVGLGLMLAMLITPATTAFLLTRRLPWMMGIGAAVGILSGVAGLYLSFYWGIPSGAAIVLVAIGFFLLALLVSRRRGVLRRKPPRSTPNRSVAAE